MMRSTSGSPLLLLLVLACAAPAGTPANGREPAASRVDDGASSNDRGRERKKEKKQQREEQEREKKDQDRQDHERDEGREHGKQNEAPRGRPAFRDRRTVFPDPEAARPAYLRAVDEPTFGSRLIRIAGETGAPIPALSGRWGADARHGYSKQQPWSADGSLMIVQNRGGSPSIVLLDGESYEPRAAPCSAGALWDYRWHPDRRHAHELINVNKAGTELSWFDVTTCTVTRRWTLPVRVDYGIGSGEGNPSNDGRFVALGNREGMFVVDMDPRPPLPPWPSRRIGPLYRFEPCSLSTAEPGLCKVDNLSISPSGRYIDVNFGSAADSTRDAQRIYEVDPVTLEIRPHAMAGEALRCGSFAARPNGWITPLKHADMALDPDDHEDVIVGGRSCPGSALGHVIKVRLRDGKVTSLTDPKNEAHLGHVSARNLDRRGWVYVSYGRAPGKRFSDEVIAVRLDGSGEVERIAHMHSATPGCYRCEPHAVPSPDGRRVVFASNWMEDCGGDCGSPKDIKDYVVIVPDDGSSFSGSPRSVRPARPRRRRYGRSRRRPRAARR